MKPIEDKTKEEKLREWKEDAREGLRQWAVEWTKCDIQDGKDGMGYPCGTCFTHLLGQLVREEAEEYKEHNKEVDRINEVWRFLLQLRDEDY